MKLLYDPASNGTPRTGAPIEFNCPSSTRSGWSRSESEAGIVTDADGDGAPDGCGGRFVLSGESSRIEYHPVLGEPSVDVPLRLSQAAPDPLGVSAVAFALGHDPALLAAGGFLPTPEIAALMAEGRAHVNTALLEDLVVVEIRFLATPGGEPDLPLAVPDLVLGTVRYTTVGLSAEGARLGTFLDWRAPPASTADPGLPGGSVLAAGGFFGAPGEDIGLLFEPPGPSFRRGDSNSTVAVDISDAVFTLGWLFLGGDAPSCADSADVNDDGNIDISDPVHLLGYLFLGSAEPPPPGAAACGDDPTSDALGACEDPLGVCG